MSDDYIMMYDVMPGLAHAPKMKRVLHFAETNRKLLAHYTGKVFPRLRLTPGRTLVFSGLQRRLSVKSL